MTGFICYNHAMNLLSSAVSPFLGFLAVGLLFGLCFLAVHAVKLAKIGWKNHPYSPQKKQETEQKTSAHEQTSQAQEPIYYIVERKKKRAKQTYSEPKEFRFK